MLGHAVRSPVMQTPLAGHAILIGASTSSTRPPVRGLKAGPLRPSGRGSHRDVTNLFTAGQSDAIVLHRLSATVRPRVIETSSNRRSAPTSPGVVSSAIVWSSTATTTLLAWPKRRHRARDGALLIVSGSIADEPPAHEGSRSWSGCVAARRPIAAIDPGYPLSATSREETRSGPLPR